MTSPPDDGGGVPPRERVAAAVDAYGAAAVVDWCVGLLTGAVALDDPRRPHLTWLGGPAARRFVDQPDADPSGRGYWPKVWAGRALLHCWRQLPDDAPAVAAVVGALGDPSWRVRETAAKVVCAHEVGEAAEALLPLVDDDVPRVRAAAVRALGLVGEGEALDAVRSATDDADPAVHRAAELALRRLQQRLDRW